MKIYGIDFTSAPSQQKPITWAECIFKDGVLRVEEVNGWSSFDGFEKFLRSDGPWVAGIDFPFGQPVQFINDLQWPNRWDKYVSLVASMWKDRKKGKGKFERIIKDYKIQPKRETDRLAGSIPPMRLDFQPVGKMFFQGAPRLLKSKVSVLPCRPREDSRIVVEAYPKLVALRWTGKKAYKSDSKKKQTPEHRDIRQLIVKGLQSDKFRQYYGFEFHLGQKHKFECIDDPSGDLLDALLCAVQAAWAYTKRNEGFGIPKGHELEGWIVDPLLL